MSNEELSALAAIVSFDAARLQAFNHPSRAALYEPLFPGAEEEAAYRALVDEMERRRQGFSEEEWEARKLEEAQGGSSADSDDGP